MVAYVFTTKNQGKKFVVATDSGDRDVEVVSNEGREFQVSINLGPASSVSEYNLAVSGNQHKLFEKYLKSSSLY